MTVGTKTDGKPRRHGGPSRDGRKGCAHFPQAEPTDAAEIPDDAIHVREACPSDSADIAWILHESFAGYEPLYTRAAFAVTTPAPDGVLERMKEGPVWVATQDGRFVGTASVVPKESRLYVRGMAVIPAARGRGVGRLLLDRIEAFAAGRRFSSLFLSTAPFLREAIDLYERRGFHRTDEGPFDLLGTPLFTMEKRL